MTGMVMVTRGGGCAGKSSKSAAAEEHDKQQAEESQQLSLLDFILSALRKSMVSTCRVDRQDQEVISAVHHMEIGWPTNVQHITHVTFDRFHGFLGLPVEFEVEVPCRAPSASVSVFGVSADSMQCSYDSRGNSVPTILLLMQDRLYSQEGLKSEGIFRINPENGQEEHVRDQLNRGIVPQDIDVHCLAGLIKAWFRELPSGVLDGLSPEEVLQCNTEEESDELIKQLKPTETALLNWAVDLMADVVEHEESNKMNARNIAMVFAPNMTQMSDPLTALMHAVQVMNLLKTLITKALRERDEAGDGAYSPLSSRSSERESDEEYDSQQEMDTSSESDDNEQGEYSPCSKDRDEVESLSDIEECFLRQLNENESAKNGFRKQLEGILCRDHESPVSGSSPFNADSGLSLSDSRMGSSFISTSDGEDSRMSSMASGLKMATENLPSASATIQELNDNDMNVADNVVESVMSKQLCVPDAAV
ncbi:Rho GTPase activating protein with PAK-box/P21-Rho-binding domain-containing protein [Perilla frutescens var. hirtella]|nr:Rho GTPase activating protein with PAK-box/P21-Rho-binding domain-containing protein [Perilla frutescens var. hirtella]